MSLSVNAEPLESLWNQVHLSFGFKEIVSCVSNGLEYVKGVPIHTRKTGKLSP